MDTSESPSSAERKPLPTSIPRFPVNLRAHKGILAIHWGVLIFVSSVLPLAGYFSLRYATTMKVQHILSIFTPIFGAVSLYSFIMRTVRLARPTSTCRPLGVMPGYGWGRSWALDYFDWNFALGFCVVTAVIAASIAKKPSDVRIASLPLSVLLLQVAGQMVLLIPLRAFGWRVPCRISSYTKGEKARPAVYTIIEDIVAVDGKQGTDFRRIFDERWHASPEFRRLLEQMDILWGVTGVIVAGVCIGVGFGVKSTDAAAWAIGKTLLPEHLELSFVSYLYELSGHQLKSTITGWSLPWLWAFVMTFISIQRTKAMCRRENAMFSAETPNTKATA